jgi:hypothetical protein
MTNSQHFSPEKRQTFTDVSFKGTLEAMPAGVERSSIRLKCCLAIEGNGEDSETNPFLNPLLRFEMSLSPITKGMLTLKRLE